MMGLIHWIVAILMAVAASTPAVGASHRRFLEDRSTNESEDGDHYNNNDDSGKQEKRSMSKRSMGKRSMGKRSMGKGTIGEKEIIFRKKKMKKDDQNRGKHVKRSKDEAISFKKNDEKSKDMTACHPHAVTAWWLIFNYPEHCLTDPTGPIKCSETDLFIPDVQAAMVHAAGTLSKGPGTVFMSASLLRSPSPRSLQEGEREDGLDLSYNIDPMSFSRGYFRRTAEVAFQIVDHGEHIDYTQMMHHQDMHCRLRQRNCTVILEAQWAVGESGFKDFEGRSNYTARGKGLLLRETADAMQMYVEI